MVTQDHSFWLQRRLKDLPSPLLMGIGILLPPPEPTSAAKPPATSDEQTIEKRKLLLLGAIFITNNCERTPTETNLDQTSTERLTQWYNWSNWPNWPNWGNWFNR